jgi:hypothetical protein
MKGKKIRRGFSVFAFILGIFTFIDGLPILFNITIPDYKVLHWLLYYNLIMAVVTIIAGIGFWRGHKPAIPLSSILAIGHTIVMIMILTAFADLVALKSQIAMTIRSVAWILIFAISFKNKEDWFV